jgi:hypothetical protein
MIVSVGTGTSEVKFSHQEVRALGKKTAIFWGSTVPDMFIRDCCEFNELLMQSLSASPTARKIDSEIGKLEGDQLAGTPRMHYLRYNAYVTDEDVKASRALTATDQRKFPRIDKVADLMQMDAGRNVYHLAALGQRAAATSLSAEAFEAHFPKAFDLKSGA